MIEWKRPNKENVENGKCYLILFRGEHGIGIGLAKAIAIRPSEWNEETEYWEFIPNTEHEWSWKNIYSQVRIRGPVVRGLYEGAPKEVDMSNRSPLESGSVLYYADVSSLNLPSDLPSIKTCECDCSNKKQQGSYDNN